MANLVKSASRVAEVIRVLAAEGPGLSVSQIAEALHIPKSSAHGLMRTLEQCRVLVRDSGGLYFVTSSFAAESNRAAMSADFITIADAGMRAFLDSAGKACSFSVLAALDQDEVVYLHVVEAPQDGGFSLTVRTGARQKAYKSASGKILAAQMSSLELDEWLRHATVGDRSGTLNGQKHFLAEVKSAQQLGYALDIEGSFEGVVCAAVPVWVPRLSQHISLSVVGPRTAADQLGLEGLARVLCGVARDIEDQLIP